MLAAGRELGLREDKAAPGAGGGGGGGIAGEVNQVRVVGRKSGPARPSHRRLPRQHRRQLLGPFRAVSVGHSGKRVYRHGMGCDARESESERRVYIVVGREWSILAAHLSGG